MVSSTKGRLIALLAMTALASSQAMAQSDGVLPDLQAAPPEQAAAYEQAVQEGPAALIDFLETFPGSPLVPAVIRALADLIGVEAAIQAALNAGVPTEVVFQVAAILSPGLFSAVGQMPDGTSSSGKFADMQADAESAGPY
jgi:hypothetical protein